MLTLTARQAEVYRWMLDYQRTHCMPPTVREVAEFVSDAAAPEAALCHLRALQRKGAVEYHPGRARGWRAIPPTGVLAGWVAGLVVLSANGSEVRLSRDEAIEAVRLLAAVLEEG